MATGVRYIDSLQGQRPTLAEWLRSGLAAAESIRIRTGFLSLSAVMELESAIEDFLGRGGRLFVVAGGAPDQADPQALAALAELLEPHESATLRIVVDPDEFQNAKVYHLAFPDGHAEAIVGSANLTRGGLETNHEAVLLLDSRIDAEKVVVSEIQSGIEAFRDRPGSVSISEETRLLLAGRRTARVRSEVHGDLQPLQPTRSLGEALEPAIDRIDGTASSGGLSGVPTGFVELDAITGGLAPGTLTVVAGRPGMGSSTLVLDMVRHTAVRQSERALLWCLDRNTDDLVGHILSAEARIRRVSMMTGRMSDDEWIRLSEKATQLSRSPLLLNTTPRPQLRSLCAHIGALHHSEPLHLVAVDPMNMIDPALPPDSGREREISAVARRLKVLALELSIPIVVTAEIGRAVEYRTDKRATIHDFRDSDALAQVADNVILLHRPDSLDRDDPRGGEADLHLAKHRSGYTAIVTVAHQLHIGRFANLARP